MALDRALGGDGGTELLSSGSSSGSDSACRLLTDADVEAASGRKVMKHEGNGDSCGWVLAASGTTIAGQAAPAGNISLQIISELALKIIPVLGEQKAIPGLGDKAEWSGGMAPNLRVHVKGGKVLNFMFVDPALMMKNPGITETPVKSHTTKMAGGSMTETTTAVNMEYPELEKEAIALGKAAVARY